MERQGRINAYVCAECKGRTVTRNANEGVTPFCIRCRVCNAGTATSMFYRCPPEEPEWEWYRPDADEMAQFDNALRDHVERGGLLLRKIEKGGGA